MFIIFTDENKYIFVPAQLLGETKGDTLPAEKDRKGQHPNILRKEAGVGRVEQNKQLPKERKPLPHLSHGFEIWAPLQAVMGYNLKQQSQEGYGWVRIYLRIYSPCSWLSPLTLT